MMDDIDRAYCSIGEFVVAFQWAENKYREIGWFILDPKREQWPPLQLRKETNESLVNKVTDLFFDLVQSHSFSNGTEQAADFETLRNEFHDLRRFRNRLLHSTYVEIKDEDEVLGYIRSNPKLTVDSDTGELIYDQEQFSAEVVHAKLAEVANAMLRLGQHYIQLIHWSPFERFPKV